MKELIFGLTDKINTPYFYESISMETQDFESIDITHKPKLTHVFLTPDGCEILDDSDPEAGLDFNYQVLGANELPNNTPRSLDFGSNEDLEDTEYAHDFTFLILILSGVLNEAV